jgi:hypothetical protein
VSTTEARQTDVRENAKRQKYKTRERQRESKSVLGHEASVAVVQPHLKGRIARDGLEQEYGREKCSLSKRKQN